MISYKLYQNNRKNSTTRGQWYARAAITGEASLETLAERIQRNCTAKKSDVMAVLTELVEVMTDELQAGHRVKLDGFGAFKIGIRSKGAASAKEYSVTKHVTGVRCNFQPEVRHSADGSRVKTFLTGVKLTEATDYHVEKDGEQETQEP